MKQLGLDQIQPTNIYCMGNESMWEKGLSISNFLRNVNAYFKLIGISYFEKKKKNYKRISNFIPDLD